MDLKSPNRGKAISISTPSFSFRYNAEDEEVEQVYFPSSEPETTKSEDVTSLATLETKDATKSRDSSPILPKASRRSGSLDECGSPEPWRIFTEIKGRITKTVEEKIEEIKSDRIKLGKKKKLLNTSSLSDSEERSEASSSLKDISDKSFSEKQKDFVADSDLGDISDTSLTPDDRATPVITEVDLSEGTPSKETLSQCLITPKKVALQSTCPNSEQEKNIHVPHKKIKSKTRGKIEMGVEAVEEATGKEEGRITQLMKVDGSNYTKQSSLFPNISVRAAIYFALLAVLYVFVNIPQFLFGLIVGGFLSIEFGFWSDCQKIRSPDDLSPMHLSARSSVDNSLFSSASDCPQNTVYEGWMNEFCYEYQPEIYHVKQTETVLVRLEGSVLKLASPRQKISKRAFWNEPSYKLRFDRERTYEISGCQVVLLPDKLAHKRIWSKKYPICIILKPNSHLGTRYRERGASSLDFVSYKGHSAKKTTDQEKNQEISSTDGNPDEEKKEDPTDDEGEVVFYSDEEDEDDGLSSDYVKVPTSIINKNNIYLFARTDREKDQWFRRLLAAAKPKLKNEESSDSINEANLEKNETEKIENTDELYNLYMTRIIGRKFSCQGTDDNVDICEEEEEEDLVWLNLFLGRILFDFMHDPYWIKQIQEKIQKKLSAIKVPSFMEELLVSQVELSDSIPVIEKSGLPKFNIDGIWVDLDISYKGTFKMTIDTKINIIKLKNSCGTPSKTEGNESPEIQERTISKSAIFDSEVEDSAESSCDDLDTEDPNSKSTNSRTNTSHKVLQMVDKIAASKYFQQVTDNKYVKKALEGVSNTTISLVVEVKSLVGTIVLNFPPPPSDRLWYGFRPNTRLVLSAKPKVGQRGINMTYITSYIEKKLLREFEKLLVMPNMDDLIIPVMNKSKPS